MEIKFKQGVTTSDVSQVLQNDKELNEYIEKKVDKSSDWVIFANANLFVENRINKYKNIRVIYNSFVHNNTVAIIYKNGIRN